MGLGDLELDPVPHKGCGSGCRRQKSSKACTKKMLKTTTPLTYTLKRGRKKMRRKLCLGGQRISTVCRGLKEYLDSIPSNFESFLFFFQMDNHCFQLTRQFVYKYILEKELNENQEERRKKLKLMGLRGQKWIQFGAIFFSSFFFFLLEFLCFFFCQGSW